jgi:hypothetical protein
MVDRKSSLCEQVPKADLGPATAILRPAVETQQERRHHERMPSGPQHGIEVAHAAQGPKEMLEDLIGDDEVTARDKISIEWLNAKVKIWVV